MKHASSRLRLRGKPRLCCSKCCLLRDSSQCARLTAGRPSRWTTPVCPLTPLPDPLRFVCRKLRDFNFLPRLQRHRSHCQARLRGRCAAACSTRRGGEQMGGSKPEKSSEQPKTSQEEEGCLERRKRWSNATETARFPGDPNQKDFATRVTVGEAGYTISTNDPWTGDGKTTGHAEGDLHRHGTHSENPKKGDFVRSSDEFTGLIGGIIKWWRGN